MGRDLGEYIGLIAVASGAMVLLLSYLGAYVIGKSHGRREEQRSDAHMDRSDASERIAALESTIRGLNASVERVMDAQRLLVAQQDHLSRKVGLSSERMALPPVHSRNTPS